MRIGSIIILHLSKLWKATFFILCNVIFLVRLQENFGIDHSWERKDYRYTFYVTLPSGFWIPFLILGAWRHGRPGPVPAAHVRWQAAAGLQRHALFVVLESDFVGAWGGWVERCRHGHRPIQCLPLRVGAPTSLAPCSGLLWERKIIFGHSVKADLHARRKHKNLISTLSELDGDGDERWPQRKCRLLKLYSVKQVSFCQ